MTDGKNCEAPGGAPEPTFEQALQRLEAIVARLESGELTLDESLALFEEGVRLSRVCSARLADAEQKIERLIERSDGTVATEPLAVGERK
ncbi:MAG: exodeoxyribonuclease VII small subunit [Chloroflexota bacterium]